jgi:hypothetical protein
LIEKLDLLEACVSQRGFDVSGGVGAAFKSFVCQSRGFGAQKRFAMSCAGLQNRWRNPRVIKCVAAGIVGNRAHGLVRSYELKTKLAETTASKQRIGLFEISLGLALGFSPALVFSQQENS